MFNCQSEVSGEVRTRVREEVGNKDSFPSQKRDWGTDWYPPDGFTLCWVELFLVYWPRSSFCNPQRKRRWLWYSSLLASFCKKKWLLKLLWQWKKINILKNSRANCKTGRMWNFNSKMTRNSGKVSLQGLKNLSQLPKIVSRFPEIVSRFPENVSQFCNIYEKLYDKRYWEFNG